MKRLISFLLVSVLCISCIAPSFAAEIPSQQSNETVISVTEQNLGNGFTLKTVTSIPKVSARFHMDSVGRTITASRTQTVTHNSDWVGSMTLTANFGYNGSSAWVNSIRTSHSVAGGWSYENESSWKSGETANMSAAMIQRLAFITIAEVDPSISMSCSPSGQIS